MKKLTKVRLISWGGIIIGMTMFTALQSVNILFAVLGLVITVSAMMYEGFNNRCPHCEKKFEMNGSIPDLCPRCGNNLKDV